MENKLIQAKNKIIDDINLAEDVINDILIIIDDSKEELISLLFDTLSLINYQKNHVKLTLSHRRVEMV